MSLALLKRIVDGTQDAVADLAPAIAARAPWRGRSATLAWRCGEYGISDPGGLELLRQAAEAADRIASVRRQIDRDGEMLIVRGVPRANPLCSIERDARAALVRCLKNLNSDVEPLRDWRGNAGSGGLGVTFDQVRRG